MTATAEVLLEPTSPKCLGARVDWMRWSARVELDEKKLAELERRSKIAETHGRAAHRVGPYILEVFPPNRGRIVLSTEGIFITIFPKAPGGEILMIEEGGKPKEKRVPGWTVTIELQGALCAEIGDEEALHVAWRVARAMGVVHQARLQRLDLAADFEFLDITPEDVSQFVKRSRKMPESVQPPGIRQVLEREVEVGGNKTAARQGELAFGPEAESEIRTRPVKVKLRAKSLTSTIWMDDDESGKLKTLDEIAANDGGTLLGAPHVGPKEGTPIISVDGVRYEDATVRVHAFDGEVGSIIVGKGTDCTCTIYNKLTELLRKPENKRAAEFERWQARGWTGSDVRRVEFRVQGETLAELDARVDVHMWEGSQQELVDLQVARLRHTIPSLWSYLVGSTPEMERRDHARYKLARDIARNTCTWWSVTYDPRGSTQTKDGRIVGGKFHRGAPCGVPAEKIAACPDLFDTYGRPRPARRRVAWLRLIEKPDDPKARRTRCPPDPRWSAVQSVTWFSFAEQAPRTRKQRDTRPRSAQALGAALSTAAAANMMPELATSDGELIENEEAFVVSLGPDEIVQAWMERQLAKVMCQATKRIASDLLVGRTVQEAATHFAVRYRAAKARFPCWPLSKSPGIHKALPQAPAPMKLARNGQRAIMWDGA